MMAEMSALSYGQRTKIAQAARVSTRKRGCTCGHSLKVAVLSGREPQAEGLDRVKVAVEHLRECPLWVDRDLGDDLTDTKPDSVEPIDLGAGA